MAALDLFIRPAADDPHPLNRHALLTLGASERTQRLDALQSEIRTRLAATRDARDWRNEVGMIVADLRRRGHDLRRDGDSHSWVGDLAVNFCRDGNTVLDWRS